MYTHTQARVLAHTYYDNTVGEQSCPLLVENYWGSEQRKVCEKGGGGSDGGRGRKSGALIRKREEEQSEKQEVHGHHDGMGMGGGPDPTYR